MNKFAKLLNKVSFFEELVGLSINKFADSQIDLVEPLKDNLPPFRMHPVFGPPPAGYDVSNRINAPKGEDPGLFMSPESAKKGLQNMMQPKPVHGPGFTGGYSAVDPSTQKYVDSLQKKPSTPTAPTTIATSTQEALNEFLTRENPYYEIKVDGVYGPETREAIQTAKELLVRDGKLPSSANTKQVLDYVKQNYGKGKKLAQLYTPGFPEGHVSTYGPKANVSPSLVDGYSQLDPETKKMIEKAKGLPTPAKPLMDIKKLQKALNQLLMSDAYKDQLVRLIGTEYGEGEFIPWPLAIDGVLGKDTRKCINFAKALLGMTGKSDYELYKHIVE